MEQLALTNVSKIVASNFQTAKVFTKYGVDFCCNGGIPLNEACELNGLNINEIITEIEQMLLEPDEVNFEKMPLPKLLNYIVEVHHTYVVATIPVLQTYLAKLCAVHGEHHTELHQIKSLFDEGVSALLNHMQKEEQVLFPYIYDAHRAFENGHQLPEAHFGDIIHPITMMEAEHSAEGARFKEIETISNKYEPPRDGCQTYKVAFALLKEFEEDLHKHIHLENNNVFPRAKTLFETISSN